jgi:hypothetical protein
MPESASTTMYAGGRNGTEDRGCWAVAEPRPAPATDISASKKQIAAKPIEMRPIMPRIATAAWRPKILPQMPLDQKPAPSAEICTKRGSTN